MEQLLFVTTTQTNELIASFQDKFIKLKSNHDYSLRKLLRDSKSQRHYNQTSIDRITKTHNKQMFQLESEYQVSLTHVKNRHKKKISCMREKLSALEDSVMRAHNQNSDYMRRSTHAWNPNAWGYRMK